MKIVYIMYAARNTMHFHEKGNQMIYENHNNTILHVLDCPGSNLISQKSIFGFVDKTVIPRSPLLGTNEVSQPTNTIILNICIKELNNRKYSGRYNKHISRFIKFFVIIYLWRNLLRGIFYIKIYLFSVILNSLQRIFPQPNLSIGRVSITLYNFNI